MAGSPRLVCSYRKNNARRQRLSLHRDQAAIRHHHQPADRNPECHGAHSREGQLLAIPAMLALKCALRTGLRVASQPLRCAPWPGPCQVGTEKGAKNDLTGKAPYKFWPLCSRSTGSAIRPCAGGQTPDSTRARLARGTLRPPLTALEAQREHRPGRWFRDGRRTRWSEYGRATRHEEVQRRGANDFVQTHAADREAAVERRELEYTVSRQVIVVIAPEAI